MMCHSIRDLELLSDEELIAAHDEAAKHTMVGTKYFLEELHRRDATRSAQRQEAINNHMLKITKRMEVTTLLALVISVVSLIVSLRK